MKVEWRVIEDYNYEVSNTGLVRNIKTKKIISPSLSKYYRVNLYKNGKFKTILVHRLVGEYFCNRELGLDIIHHLDNNTLNNNYENLLWTTQSYNVKMAYKDGLISDRNGVNNPNYKNGKYNKWRKL